MFKYLLNLSLIGFFSLHSMEGPDNRQLRPLGGDRQPINMVKEQDEKDYQVVKVGRQSGVIYPTLKDAKLAIQKGISNQENSFLGNVIGLEYSKINGATGTFTATLIDDGILMACKSSVMELLQSAESFAAQKETCFKVFLSSGDKYVRVVLPENNHINTEMHQDVNLALFKLIFPTGTNTIFEEDKITEYAHLSFAKSEQNYRQGLAVSYANIYIEDNPLPYFNHCARSVSAHQCKKGDGIFTSSLPYAISAEQRKKLLSEAYSTGRNLDAINALVKSFVKKEKLVFLNTTASLLNNNYCYGSLLVSPDGKAFGMLTKSNVTHDISERRQIVYITRDQVFLNLTDLVIQKWIAMAIKKLNA